MERVLGRKLTALKVGVRGPVTVFILLALLFLCVAEVSWANPKTKLKATSPIIWSFDSEKAGTLPPSFLVGRLVDGRSAGKWQVINMNSPHKRRLRFSFAVHV